MGTRQNHRGYGRALLCRAPLISGVSILIGCAFGTMLSAQVVLPDGGSATGFSLEADGKITVTIAPADVNAVSYNSYTNFSVPVAGVDLDNTTAGAGTIINEVTSTNPTMIQGAVTVIGPESHVIIANPNGIIVDGGRFVNTGQAALTTGVMSVDGAGLPVSTVSMGQITTNGGGLSGAMAGLELIAKSIRVNGGIGFDTTSAPGAINIIAGDSTISFDALRAAGGILPWAMPVSTGSATTDAVIVDITQSGSIDAGRISVTVTDMGAGVRIAGDQLAGSGGFRLTADGQLVIDNASVTAVGSVNINAGSVVLAESTLLTSETRGVTIEAVNGDVDLGNAQVSGAQISSDNLASAGGVTIIADGSIIAQGNADARTTLSSSESHVALFADGAITLNSLDIDAADGFNLSAGGAISFDDVVVDAGGDMIALSNDVIEFDAVTINANASIRLDAASLRFGANDPDQSRTELVANTGGLTLHASAGSIVNNGSLLQGAESVPGQVDSLGAVSIYAAGDFINHSLSVGKLAVAFGQSDDLYIDVGGDVINDTGRLFSNQGITILAVGDIRNETSFTEIAENFGIENHLGDRYLESLFLLRSKITSATANYGDFTIAGERALILGVGDVILSAHNITNIGAEITGIDVDVLATMTIRNAARLVGNLDYRRTCKIFCSTSGYSDVQKIGGLLNASGALNITAGESIISRSGQLVGNQGIDISAPLTEFASAPFVTFIERPVGLLGLFGGSHIWILVENDFGSITSFAGQITIDGDVILGDVQINAQDAPTITGTIIESSESSFSFTTPRGPIGLFWVLF